MTIYELNGVRYTVPENGRSKSILRVDELRLAEGGIAGVIGPNGAGKTTLLKIMAFLEPPTAGTLTYRGQAVDLRAVPLHIRRSMATVFQQSLLLDMSVRQNVALGLAFRGVAKKERYELVDEWLHRFHVDHLAHRHAHTLSGGEAQRVSLARALVLKPDILFLDEPFAALDFPTKVALMEDLKKALQGTGTTTLFVSHDLMEVRFMTDRLIVMVGGEVAQTGTTAEVIQHPNELTRPFLDRWRTFAALGTGR